MNAIQRFVFNLFLFCVGFGLFLFVKLDSYAFPSFAYSCVNGNQGYQEDFSVVFRDTGSSRLAIYVENPLSTRKHLVFYSNSSARLYFDVVSYPDHQTDVGYFDMYSVSGHSDVYYASVPYSWLNLTSYVWSFTTNPQVRVFTDLDSLYDYIANGTLPSLNYDSSLELDSFKVTSWNVGNIQALFKSKFEVKWSDSRISFVQVHITGTGNEATYESSSSPFSRKFQADHFVMKNGDVIHLVATPYKSDGSYGTSLYYSVTYSDNIPFSNTYRKLVNTPSNNNTLTIPYSGTSGNDNVSVPVDGVTTNVTYKVNYNPVTNEYNNQNIYEIYYSPVIVYPDNTSDQEVDDTQDTIINNYNTTNYYETIKNINIDFDVSFGDISGSDIQRTYDDIGNFSNGFGSLLGKLSSWILALFPFLSPAVASTIVVCGGLIITLAIIAFVLKIAGVIADLIPF